MGSTSSTGGTSATAMTIPCAPLKNPNEMNATPGRCENGAAITCGQDGFLETEVCAAGDSCQVYSLQEYRFNGSIDNPAWEPGPRTIEWAGCLPPGEPCTMEWNGQYFTPVNGPYCDGPDQNRCLWKPAPNLSDFSPQMQFGTEEGWLQTETCPNGSRCAGGENYPDFVCIDEATPDCDGTEPRCLGNGIERCIGAWADPPGYKAIEACAANQICYEGTDYPFCSEPGAVPCTEGTPIVCTSDGTAVASCSNGYIGHRSCATCWDGAQMVPCRCDSILDGRGGGCTEYQQIACVPQAAVDCDLASAVDTCVGNVAHRCIGYWDDVDCASLGKICGVVDGIAGCRDANAQPCEAGPTPNRCEADIVVSCCACGSAYGFPPSSVIPCVTGYEVRSDCGAVPDYECGDLPPSSAYCYFNP
jgi:hypothetical protein